MFKRKSTSEDQENGNVSCSSSSSSSSWSSAVLNLPKKLKTDNNNNRVVLGDNQAVQMEEDVSTEPVPTVKPKVTTSQTFKSILQRTLSSGKYSVSGEADELPMYPNIHVNNFGPISLPLNESQAIELLNKCSFTPFDCVQSKNDINSCNSYQIDSSQISFHHSDWDRNINTLVNKIVKQMGASNRTENVKLQKMILFKAGSQILRHTDTARDKNAFATLIIQLPSIYTGSGEFIVYNVNGSAEKYTFGQSTDKAAVKMHYTAFYSDLEHEMKPITSGYRLELVYSISASDNNEYLLSNTEAARKISSTLMSLTQLNKPIAMVLEHEKWSEFQHVVPLRGVNLDRYNILKSASTLLSNENQLCFYVVKACLKFEADKPGLYSNQVLTAELEQKLKEKNKSKQLETWYEIEGNRLPYSEVKPKVVTLDFFGDVFVLSNTTGDNINSWIREGHEYAKTNENVSVRLEKYYKYLLAFWPQKLTCKLMLDISVKTLIDSLVDEPNKDIKATNLENLFSILAPKKKSARAESTSNSNLTVGSECASSDNLTVGSESTIESDITDDDDDSNKEMETDENSEDYSSEDLEIEELPTISVKLDSDCYAKLTHLVVCLKKPQLIKLFVDLLGQEESASIRTETIYKIWKSGQLDTETLRANLINLIENEQPVIVLELLDQQIAMLNHLKDSKLTQTFSNKAIQTIRNQEYVTRTIKLTYFMQVMELIGCTDLKLHIQTIFEFFNASKHDIRMNCSLIKLLVSSKQTQVASMCLEEFVMPYVAVANEFLRLGNNTTYYNIFECLFILDREEELIKLKDLIIDKYDQNKLHDLLSEFVARRLNPIDFSACKPIVDLFKYRLHQLDCSLHSPDFNWTMPGQIPEHRDVTYFLNTNRQTMTYSAFSNKPQAEQFVRSYSGPKQGYSTEMIAVKNTNQSPFVFITKTMDYFNSNKTAIRKVINEKINYLKPFLH